MTVAALDRLDALTEFDHRPWYRGWVYPDAYEVVTSRRRAGSRRSSELLRTQLDPLAGRPSADSLRVIRSRARCAMGRYAVANGCDRFVTCTSKTRFTRPQIQSEVTAAFRRAKRFVGASRPFVWVAELGHTRMHVFESQPDGIPPVEDQHKRAHAHALLPDDLATAFVKRWSAGFVDVRVLAERQDIRRTARYMSKQFDWYRGQRYRVAKGFAPARVAIAYPSEETLVGAMNEFFGAEPTNKAVDDHIGCLEY